MTITDKQAERLFEIIREASGWASMSAKEVAALKREFVEILTWGSATDAGKK